MDLITIIISTLYAATGVVALIGYYPTIRDLLHQKKSANAPSYAIWTLTYFVGVLYALLVIGDVLLSIVMGIGLICCLAILVLRLRLE